MVLAVTRPEPVRERVREQEHKLRPELQPVAAAEPVVIGAMVLGRTAVLAPVVRLGLTVPAATALTETAQK